VNKGLEKMFEKLERQRKFILSEVSRMPVSTYGKAAGNKWSVAKILMHLVTTEQMSLTYVRKKSLGIENLKKSGPMEAIKMVALKISQRLPIRYNAPKAIVERTPEPLPLEALTLEWLKLRMELKAFAETVSEENVRKKIFKHPFAGNFKLEQGLDFIYEHIRHHWPQIKRQLE
jgi:hypothetical protein